MFDYDKFFAENPLDIHNQVERHETIASLCRGTVFDIGCGTGSLTEYFKGDYVGFDISKIAVEKARKHRRGSASFECLDFTKQKDSDFSQADTIVMSEFLEHIDSDENIFDSIKKTVSPGTRIIVSVPNYKAVPSPDHVREFTVASLCKKLSSLGSVHFIDWIGSDKRIICYIDFGSYTRPKVTLGVIAKNEAKGIERLLLSSFKCCDDIVVLVDDSTTDKTAEIARRYTDNVFMYKWQNDFSDARNQLVEKVKSPFVFFVDGHEYIKTPPDVSNLLADGHDAIMVQITLDNGSIVRYPRLHKTNLKYENAVHNKLVAHNLGNDENAMLVHDRIHGQSEESTKAREAQRHEMIVGIMGKQIKENKKNVRASMHLGLHYHARQEYKKAIKYYKLYLKYSEFKGERWYITFNIVLCYLQLKKLWRAEYYAKMLPIESRNRWENDYILGLCFFTQKDYLESVKQYINSLGVREQESEYKPLPRDLSVIWNQIGECFFNLKQFENAGIAFHRAASFCEIDEFKKLLFKRGELMDQMAKQK